MESFSNIKVPEKRKKPEKQGKLKTLNHGIQEVSGLIFHNSREKGIALLIAIPFAYFFFRSWPAMPLTAIIQASLRRWSMYLLTSILAISSSFFMPGV